MPAMPPLLAPLLLLLLRPPGCRGPLVAADNVAGSSPPLRRSAGFFRVDLGGGGGSGGPAQVEVVALSEDTSEELSPSDSLSFSARAELPAPLVGAVDEEKPFGRRLCEWLHSSLPLRAPPPLACEDESCRCEDEAELFDLALSVSAPSRPSSRSTGAPADEAKQPQSCAELIWIQEEAGGGSGASGDGGGCRGGLAKYCARSCGLCREGYVLETSSRRKPKPPLASDRCRDRQRPSWAAFWADGREARLDEVDWQAALREPGRLSLYVSELGVLRFPPALLAGEGSGSSSTAPARIAAVSSAPAVFAISGSPEAGGSLLSAADVAEIIARAKPKMERAKVEDYGAGAGPQAATSSFGGGSGIQIAHASRNNSVAWLNPVDDGAAVRRLFALGAKILGAKNFNHLEKLQVLRYEPGELYQQHTDFFEHWRNPQGSAARSELLRRTRKGQANRVATLLWYLQEPPGGGGATNFPHARATESAHSAPGGLPPGAAAEFAECGMCGAVVKAQAGRAVLFYSAHSNGSLDARSQHAACPPDVAADIADPGEGGRAKWAANLWYWNSEVSEWPEETLSELAEEAASTAAREGGAGGGAEAREAEEGHLEM